jgi:polysaccharide export outer membrane protein
MKNLLGTRRSRYPAMIACAVAFSSCALLAGQTPTNIARPASSVPAESSPVQPPDLRIGAGDLLDVHIYGAPELSESLRVSNGGDVSMPLIGTVRIAGLTTAQAQNEIERLYVKGAYLRNPHVNILVKEFATQGVSVLGEVTKPGIYPLLGSRRLYDVISEAGGTTTRAGKVISITHRAEPGKPELVAISNDPALVARANVDIQPGDTVMVSKSGIVYVTGDVKLPGGFVMEQNENLTVLQAIALAQGLNSTASLKSVRVIRRSGGKLEEIPVELKQIMAAKSPDIALKNEDVLLVPNSASKSAARRSLESIVQVATGVAIYRR